MAILEVVAVLFSARGTIANPAPRNKLPWILYVQTLLLFVELAWDCVGVVWAFDPTTDCSASHKVVIFVRMVLLWNLFSAAIIASYMVVRIGVCGLCCRRTPRRLKYETFEPRTTYHGRRLSRASSPTLLQNARQRTWQWRLQQLFCCLKLRDWQRNVFTEVSATLSDACRNFRGYVPSDVLAGMALVAMDQTTLRKPKSKSKHQETNSRINMNFDERGVQSLVNKMIKYMKYASAGYGWWYYVYSKGIIGYIKLIFSCCCSKETKEIEVMDDDEDSIHGPPITGDNKCRWNTFVIRKITGCSERSILHASFNSEVFCPAFYVAADHDDQVIVVTIRGTLSVMDALTDFSALPGLLMVKDSIKFYAHQGLINAAEALKLKLEGEGILHRAFHRYPTYKLVINGHSMGGGCASLLAVLLHSTYPNLHCYAFAPPGGIISASAVSHTRRFITTLVLGNDLVPRLSLQNVEALGERVLYKMQTSQLPKYRIFLRSFFRWLGVTKPTKQEKQEAKQKNIPRKESEDVMLHHKEAEMKEIEGNSKKDPVTGKTVLPPLVGRHDLYLPGRIIHLQWNNKKSNCCGLCKTRSLTAQWTAHTEFSELFLDHDIVSDHMPDNILKALAGLKKQEAI